MLNYFSIHKKGILCSFFVKSLTSCKKIGMFVAEGAKENILNRRRNEFFDHYVKKLLEEAASIGLDKNEVIKLIQSADQ